MSSNSYPPGSLDKALELNLDPLVYGTFAEIGAGQEVANWFFRAGATSGTVAKTISAYDMTFSDAIYGSVPRYVSRARLRGMLEHEYELLTERLGGKRGERSTFFAFANTVRARGYRDTGECHGWLGVRFQTEPGSPPHDVLMHVRLLDDENTEQMEALGIAGVNLIYGCFRYRHDRDSFLHGLMDGLNRERIEIDMVKFIGPEFAGVDNRVVALGLVENDLTDAALFGPDGEVMQPAERFYNKPIFLMRGSFNPVTQVNLDMMEAGRAQFEHDYGDDAEGIVQLMEMTTRNLLQRDGRVDHENFIARAELLQALGQTVMVSKFAEFHRLGAYLCRYTRQPTGIVLGVPLLEEIFEEKWYQNLGGGILESFGRLFKHRLHLYVYPAIDRDSGEMKRAHDATVEPHLRHLFLHLLENSHIRGIDRCLKACVPYSSADVRRMIHAGEEGWQRLVPPVVLENSWWSREFTEECRRNEAEEADDDSRRRAPVTTAGGAAG